MTANKLGAAWYHRHRYYTIEDRLISAAREKPIHPKAHLTIGAAKEAALPDQGVSPELHYECDAFLVQLKSTLDHLVKIPGVTFGPSWTLRTFGKRGLDVVNAARKLPSRFERVAAGLITHVEYNREWIDAAIEIRDRSNHLLQGGVTPDKFSVFAVAQAAGEARLVVPLWTNEITIRQALEELWPSLYSFCEDFIAISLASKLARGLTLMRRSIPLTTADSSWIVVETGRKDEIAAELGLNLADPPRIEANPPRRYPKLKDLCHCGSGRMYKKCHNAEDQARFRAKKG